MGPSFWIVCVIASVTTLCTRASPTKTANVARALPSSPAHYLFLFGDSYTATGFNISGTLPSQANPYGNPMYPGYTSCNGPNWLDNLVTAQPPNLGTAANKGSPTNTLSYNFAVGGSTVDNRYANLPGGVNPFTVQATTFTNSTIAKTPHPPIAQWTSANSAFLVWFGVNDVDIITYQNPQQPNVIPKIMDTYFTVLNQLVAAGARNFVLMGVPPLWRAPGNLNNAANIKANCTQWNAVLKRRTTTFNSNHSQVRAVFIDIQPFFNKVLDNPTTYGAQDATCSNSDGVSCCWVDGIHPSLAIHRVVGQGIQSLLYGHGFFSQSALTAAVGPIPQFASNGPLPGPNPGQALFDAELIS